MLKSSHGTGEFEYSELAKIGDGVIIEPGVIVFHPENIEIGNNVYVGHNSILKGYYRNKMIIEDGVWIGQQCFLHSAGGLTIHKNVGIGPGVKIITSSHVEEGINKPILQSEIKYSPVVINEDCDIGTGAIILPGVMLGRGVQVGAGSVVTKDIKPYAVIAGSPARVLRYRV